MIEVSPLAIGEEEVVKLVEFVKAQAGVIDGDAQTPAEVTLPENVSKLETVAPSGVSTPESRASLQSEGLDSGITETPPERNFHTPEPTLPAAFPYPTTSSLSPYDSGMYYHSDSSVEYVNLGEGPSASLDTKLSVTEILFNGDTIVVKVNTN